MKYLIILLSVLFLFSSCKKDPITPPIINDSDLIGHWEYPDGMGFCATFHADGNMDYHIECNVNSYQAEYTTIGDTLHIGTPSGITTASWYRVSGDTLALYNPNLPSYLFKQ